MPSEGAAVHAFFFSWESGQFVVKMRIGVANYKLGRSHRIMSSRGGFKYEGFSPASFEGHQPHAETGIHYECSEGTFHEK